MNNEYKSIILVTDTTKISQAAGQTALDMAKLNSAKVTIVDTVRRPSMMSKWLSSNTQDLFDLVVTEKQERLDKFASVFDEAGIEHETKVLVGNSSEEISRLAINQDADIVIRYMKGINSRMSGPFGTTARNLMRVCPCPLLLIGDTPVSDPKVLACVNVEHSESENQGVLTETERIAGPQGQWQLLYCWDFYGSEYLSHYVNEATIKKYNNEALKNNESIVDKFLENHALTSSKDRIHMEQGDPVVLIPEFCRKQSIDVVVMSSASHNHPLHRLLGSTVESVLDELPCSLLVVKPTGFKSPIKAIPTSVETKN